MKITNIGMPNTYGLVIKKTVEDFWKDEASPQDITSADNLVKDFNRKAQAHFDLSPVGDFDLYDRMLKTASNFGMLSRRFGSPEEASKDFATYLSVGRGDKDKDIPAAPMVKWFDTNYHVVQPEIEEDPRLLDFPEIPYVNSGEKLALIGPLTLLSYSINKTERTDGELFDKLSKEYVKLVDMLPDQAIVQLEEPSFLTHGIPSEYSEFVDQLNKRTHLHVYFGAANNFAEDLFSLNVEGIGLDFVDGPENLELLGDFPEDKYLIAGIINGRNVWPASTNTKDTLDEILNFIDEDRLYISPSCSLMHVPLTSINESYPFSFAMEKLGELIAIKGDYIEYQGISEEEAPLPEERIERSRTEPWVSDVAYATTTTGSFPQLPEVRRTRSKWKRGEISDEEYEEKIKSFIADCVRRQEETGLDVLVHGEFERPDMVQYFAENFEGFTPIKGEVQSYGTRFVRPPVVTGTISRPKAFTVPWSSYAQSLTDKPIKGMLTGPVTLSRWSFPREDISREAQFYEFAEALRAEVNDLNAAGIMHVQVDEPAIREGLPLDREKWDHYLFHAVNSFRQVFADMPDDAVAHTHMCFSEFGDIWSSIRDMGADVYLVEDSKAQSKLVDIIGEQGFSASIGLGVFDVHSPRIPSVEEMAQVPIRYSENLDANRIWVNPDCGLKTRGEEAWEQLENMVEAVQKLRTDS